MLNRHQTITAAALGLLLFLVVLATLFLLRPTPQTTSVFYASATGSGSACTETAPCRIRDWWPLAGPGATLLLLDGTYTGTDSMLTPPDGLSGTQAAPITVKALHDGQVTLDAAGKFAVHLQPNTHWWAIHGINAHSGGEALYRIRGDHHRMYRVIGWNGTSGQADSNIFSFAGEDFMCEDCAAWGSNSRKLFSGSQSTAPDQRQQFGGFRRTWGEWNGHPGGASCPNNVFQVAYRSRQQRFENVIGTVRVTGEVCDFEAVIDASYDCNAPDMATGSQVLGSLFYVPDSTPFPSPGSGTVVFATCISTLTYRDVAAVLGSTHVMQQPFDFRNSTSVVPETGNVCENCLAVHAGTPSRNQDGSGWTLPNFREGYGLAEATGGVSPFELLKGLCYRYEGGVLTNQPLWPWPMRQRIIEARRASGQPEVDVDAVVESLLGKIPPQCRTDMPPIPPEPPQPPAGQIVLNCAGKIDGTVFALQCTKPQDTR